jgi:hypothetical protein
LEEVHFTYSKPPSLPSFMVAEHRILQYRVIGEIHSRLVVDIVWIMRSRPACFATIYQSRDALPPRIFQALVHNLYQLNLYRASVMIVLLAFYIMSVYRSLCIYGL